MDLFTWSLVAVAAVPALAQDQQPLVADQEIIDTPSKGTEYPARPAYVTLHNGNKYPCVPGGDDILTTELDVPVDVCLSANFTLDNNVHLEYSGLCEGGTKTPYITIYPTSDCTGDHSHPRWSGGGPGHCLSKAVWGEAITPPEGQWSMALRCNDQDESLKTMAIKLPELPPKPESKPAPPRPTTASVSDSACYIPGMGMAGAPRFIFQRVKADTCVNVAPKHRLKIYRNALCGDGSEAKFARFEGTGCKGDPVVFKKVDEGMIADNSPGTCIDMGGEDASSYAFFCGAKDLTEGDVEEDLFPDEGDGVRLHYTYGNPPVNMRAKSDAASVSGGGRVMGIAMWVVGMIAG